MAKKLKVGDRIRQYRVTKVFGPGMMAISYGAEGPTGEKVFLKQYKSPAPTVVWYKAFVAYQNELGARVRNGRAAQFAVRQVDAFEEVWGGPCYFQAFEFVENGADLQQMLDEEREWHRRTKSPATRDPAVWARHVTWAKVFMTGMAALHESKIVHADLKPANAYLIQDPTISSGYQLKLIDMDFSLLADRRAPWHGHQGYVGTDNYRSPEHMARGSVPGLASDVFTCGLMLYELLAGYHPYWTDDQAEYAKLVQSYAAKPPALAGVMPAPASNAEVSSFLHRCLSPNPADQTDGCGAARCSERARGETIRPQSRLCDGFGKGSGQQRSSRRRRADPVRQDRVAGPGRPLAADRRKDGTRKNPGAAVRAGQRVLGQPPMCSGTPIRTAMGALACCRDHQRNPRERHGANGAIPAQAG